MSFHIKLNCRTSSSRRWLRHGGLWEIWKGSESVRCNRHDWSRYLIARRRFNRHQTFRRFRPLSSTPAPAHSQASQRWVFLEPIPHMLTPHLMEKWQVAFVYGSCSICLPSQLIEFPPQVATARVWWSHKCLLQEDPLFSILAPRWRWKHQAPPCHEIHEANVYQLIIHLYLCTLR